MQRHTVGLGAVLILIGCGGSAPPPAEAPEASTPEAPSEPPAAPEPAAEPEPEPEAPRTVSIDSVEIKGGGIEEAAIRSAVEAAYPEYEKCYATARAQAPDAKGTVNVTLLYMLGKRKSAAASYAGPGPAEIMRCFTEASQTLTLSPAADAKRTTIYIRMKLEPPGADPGS